MVFLEYVRNIICTSFRMTRVKNIIEERDSQLRFLTGMTDLRQSNWPNIILMKLLDKNIIKYLSNYYVKLVCIINYINFHYISILYDFEFNQYLNIRINNL